MDKKAGLPPLPTSDLAFYTRESPSHPMVEKLISFIANAVERWQNEANQPGAALFPNLTSRGLRTRRLEYWQPRSEWK